MHNLPDIIEDPEENIKASDIVIEKYDNMIFNPIRFQNNRKDEELMHASKCILNLPTSSLHLCSPFQQNR